MQNLLLKNLYLEGGKFEGKIKILSTCSTLCRKFAVFVRFGEFLADIVCFVNLFILLT